MPDYSPAERAGALRTAAAWLKSGSRRHIHGRKLKRVEGILFEWGGDDQPAAVCALGAAIYALDQDAPDILVRSADTSGAIRLLAGKDDRVHRDLSCAYSEFDEGVETRKGEPIKLCMQHLLAAAERLEAALPPLPSNDKRRNRG